MCQGFGIIIDKDINLWFSEPDTDGNCSHSIIIERLGWRENEDPHLRSFVRVEFADWTPESFTFDETTTLPGWCENNRHEIRNKCVSLLEKCAPAYAEYGKVCAPAWAEYEKVCAPAWAEYEKVRAPASAEYEKVCDQARAEYERVCDQAGAEYEKVRDQAWAAGGKICDQAMAAGGKICDQARAEYEKVRDQAYAEYEKVRAPASAEYEKVCDQARADTITRLKMISGYVGCKEVCRTPKPAVSKI